MHIPMSSPDIGEAEIAATSAILRTPYMSIGFQIEQGAVSLALPFFGGLVEEQVGQVYDALRRILQSGTAARRDTVTYTAKLGVGS